MKKMVLIVVAVAMIVSVFSSDFVPLAEAREMYGQNFFGPEEIEEVFGEIFNTLPNCLKRHEEYFGGGVSFSREVLEKYKDSHMLVFIVPLTGVPNPEIIGTDTETFVLDILRGFLVFEGGWNLLRLVDKDVLGSEEEKLARPAASLSFLTLLSLTQDTNLEIAGVCAGRGRVISFNEGKLLIRKYSEISHKVLGVKNVWD